MAVGCHDCMCRKARTSERSGMDRTLHLLPLALWSRSAAYRSYTMTVAAGFGPALGSPAVLPFYRFSGSMYLDGYVLQ